MSRSMEFAGPDDFTLLVDELYEQGHTVHSPNVELETAAMYRALLEQRKKRCKLGDTEPNAVDELLHITTDVMVRRGIDVGPAISGLRTTLVNYFVHAASERQEQFSDAGWVDAGDWQASFDRLEEDFAHRKEPGRNAVNYMFSISSTFINAMTSVKERYGLLELHSALLADRFPRGARVLDYGSSAMLGPLAVMNPRQGHTQDFEDVSYRALHSDITVDLTEKANALKNTRGTIKNIDAVDMFPIYYELLQRYDIGFVEYILNGLSPSERNDPGYMAELQRLINLKDSKSPSYKSDNGVTFTDANFLNEHELEDFKAENPKPFDIIDASYLMQELQPPDRIRLNAIFHGMLATDGVLMYNQTAFIAPALHGPATFADIEYYASHANVPFSSECHIFDALLPMRGLQKAASMYNNRHRIIRIGPAKLALDDKGKAQSLGDMIHRS